LTAARRIPPSFPTRRSSDLLRELLREPVRQRDGERHELRRLAAGEADHHPLIAGPLQLERVATLLCALSGLQRVPHARGDVRRLDRKSTRLNSSHVSISYAV